MCVGGVHVCMREHMYVPQHACGPKAALGVSSPSESLGWHLGLQDWYKHLYLITFSLAPEGILSLY